MTRVLQITDLHVFATPNERLKGIPTRESLQKVVDYILQNEKPFEHVIVTGDHTHDELTASYEAVAEILSPWKDRLRQVPGNHDERSIMRQVFGSRISGDGEQLIQFEFSVGEWLMIGLDTHLPGEVSGQITDQQVAELQSLLDQSTASSVALFMHHPPVDVNSVWMDAIGLQNRERLQQVVNSDNRIKLICCGHVHHEFQLPLGQAAVLTTPSTGIQFNPASDMPSFVQASPGYRVIELMGAKFNTHVVRIPDVLYPLVLN